MLGGLPHSAQGLYCPLQYLAANNRITITPALMFTLQYTIHGESHVT